MNWRTSLGIATASILMVAALLALPRIGEVAASSRALGTKATSRLKFSCIVNHSGGMPFVGLKVALFDQIPHEEFWSKVEDFESLAHLQGGWCELGHPNQATGIRVMVNTTDVAGRVEFEVETAHAPRTPYLAFGSKYYDFSSLQKGLQTTALNAVKIPHFFGPVQPEVDVEVLAFEVYLVNVEVHLPNGADSSQLRGVRVLTSSGIAEDSESVLKDPPVGEFENEYFSKGSSYQLRLKPGVYWVRAAGVEESGSITRSKHRFVHTDYLKIGREYVLKLELRAVPTVVIRVAGDREGDPQPWSVGLSLDGVTEEEKTERLPRPITIANTDGQRFHCFEALPSRRYLMMVGRLTEPNLMVIEIFEYIDTPSDLSVLNLYSDGVPRPFRE